MSSSVDTVVNRSEDNLSLIVNEIVDFVLDSASLSNKCFSIFEKKSHLFTSISVDLFEIFSLCYKCLLDKLEQKVSCDSNEFTLIHSQLKLCQHDRHYDTHLCVLSNLVNFFQKAKFACTQETTFVKNNCQLYSFLLNFKCISQIPLLLKLFNITNWCNDELIVFAQKLIDEQNFVHASIIIPTIQIKKFLNSNILLIQLLFEDNLNEIDFYLEWDLEHVDQNVIQLLSSTNFRNETVNNENLLISLKFFQFLDEVFINYELLNSHSLENIFALGKNNICKKIYRYVLDLFKKPYFENVDDSTLCQICPNITFSYFSKQISALLFRFKKETLTANVLTDHRASLKSNYHAEILLTNFDHNVVNKCLSNNKFTLASEYIQFNKLNFNIPNYMETIESDNPNIVYPFNLTLNNGIYLVDDDQSFDKCIKKIQTWKYISIDCEWFNDYFVLKNNLKLSLIQIAHDDICYIIDCYKLLLTKPLHHYLQQFIDLVINNGQVLKIGYSIDSDYNILRDSLFKSLQHDSSTELNFSPKNTLDFRDLYFFLTNNSSEYLELFDTTSLEIASLLSGISQVTQLFVGFSIDKREQMSDWSKRPLRNEQISYAALDAYCLVDCFKRFKELLKNKQNISIETFLDKYYSILLANDEYAKTLSNNRKSKNSSMFQNSTFVIAKKKTPINQFRCVLDNMLFGITRYLRICNADVIKADNSLPRDQAVKLALKEKRVFITSGQIFDRYRKFFSLPEECIHLDNSITGLEQFKELVTKCGLVIRLEDLFVRCSLCNASPFIVLPKDVFQLHYDRYKSELKTLPDAKSADSDSKLEERKLYVVDDDNANGTLKIDFEKFSPMKFTRNTLKADKFYICPNCGHVYWDGCHSSNFVQSIKHLIVDA